jgi:hypothetical protein
MGRSEGGDAIRGFDVTTLETDGQLGPDAVGSILSLPFRNRSFEIVAGSEVLLTLVFL